ncbi:MAG: hypothetical protein A3G24_12650 [Betaproteobacteria bacterium RIFCSPLOWO2_12_FULL_62_13]|nr:MAG: hypothetical protein A3G24_12650 [Betaproteobacteria bacterium RIFCSPLOWO2_12_FULL_62_13]
MRATTLERTLVDVFARPDLAGGWEEIWRSLETVEFFDLDVVVQYVLLLENATTAAKVGFFLEQHQGKNCRYALARHGVSTQPPGRPVSIRVFAQ